MDRGNVKVLNASQKGWGGGGRKKHTQAAKAVHDTILVKEKRVHIITESHVNQEQPLNCRSC